jgi:hypothetical protein
LRRGRSSGYRAAFAGLPPPARAPPLVSPPRKCNGKDEGRPCAAPAAAAFVFKDRSIRPRFWCHAHAAEVREVMRSALKKDAWTEVSLQR